MKTYKIIAINGGGVRGIFSARLLQRLNDSVPLISNTDLFAGVSTGGLISLALANGMDIESIKNFYLKECKNIFKDSFFDNLKDLFGLAGADYDIKNLEVVLKNIFGTVRVNELKKKVLVTAFDLDNEDPDKTKRSWSPLIISNLTGKFYGNNLYAYQAGCCTAAAATYFPAYNGIIDGGIVSTNPCMDAVCAILGSGQIKAEEILLLNVGTGVSLRFIEGKNIDYGYVEWAKKIVPAMMDGDDMSVHNQCRELLGNNYYRIDTVFPEGVDIPMDAVDKLNFLNAHANTICIDPLVKWLKERWITNA